MSTISYLSSFDDDTVQEEESSYFHLNHHHSHDSDDEQDYHHHQQQQNDDDDDDNREYNQDDQKKESSEGTNQVLVALASQRVRAKEEMKQDEEELQGDNTHSRMKIGTTTARYYHHNNKNNEDSDDKYDDDDKSSNNEDTSEEDEEEEEYSQDSDFVIIDDNDDENALSSPSCKQDGHEQQVIDLPSSVVSSSSSFSSSLENSNLDDNINNNNQKSGEGSERLVPAPTAKGEEPNNDHEENNDHKKQNPNTSPPSSPNGMSHHDSCSPTIIIRRCPIRRASTSGDGSNICPPFGTTNRIAVPAGSTGGQQQRGMIDGRWNKKTIINPSRLEALAKPRRQQARYDEDLPRPPPSSHGTGRDDGRSSLKKIHWREFVKRQDLMENTRKMKVHRKKMEMEYEANVNKRKCINCKTVQTFSEAMDGRNTCQCGSQYVLPKFHLGRLEQRIFESLRKKQEMVNSIQDERLNVLKKSQKSQHQRYLMEKVALKSNGNDFLKRMQDDLQRRQRHMVKLIEENNNA